MRGGMIEPPGEFLEGRSVLGSRPGATKIAADDHRFLTQFAQGPDEIVAGEAAVFPIGDCFAGDEAIDVDGDVNLVVVVVIDPVLEHRFPVSDPQRIEIGGIADAPLPPRINQEAMGLGRPAIPEEARREVALEVAATPDGDALDARILERAIDPGPGGPEGRADVPVGMIVEGEKRERLLKLPRPDGAQVMEIAGAEQGEGAEFAPVFGGEGVDLRGGRDEAEGFGFLAHIDGGEAERVAFGDKIPRIIRTKKNRGTHWPQKNTFGASINGGARNVNRSRRRIVS